MSTATATVVENKLVPIAGAVDKPTLSITAQAIGNRYTEFREAGTHRCDAIINAVYDGQKASVEEFKLATAGAIHVSRVKVGEKFEDGQETANIRKFVSYVRAVWGAVKLGRLPHFDSFTNNEKLVQAARAALAGRDGDDIVHSWAPCDWQGRKDADVEADAVKKQTVKAMKEAATEEGADDILALTPEQFAGLKSKAQKKLDEQKAKAKLESMEKRAQKIADDLLESYGFDGAEEVLKRALENLSAKMIGG